MKYLTLITIALATTAQADFWDNCTAYGGTIITANSYGNDKSGGLCNDPSNPELTNNCNGKRFCVGGMKMNWWSAFTWCESIGGQEANFLSLCPGTQALNNQPAGACPNVKGLNLQNGHFTNMGWGKERALFVLSNGSVTDLLARSTGAGYPICEEK